MPQFFFFRSFAYAAAILAIGIWWLPFSPRWLVKKGRDKEAIQVLSKLRHLPEDSDMLQLEYKEIKAEYPGTSIFTLGTAQMS